MPQYVQRDKANNQVYIGFGNDGALESGAVNNTVRATDDIALDFDRRGHLIGIDISNASRLLGRRIFTERVTADELVGVAEAAKLCQVRKPNFVRDFASRPDFPRPLAELASGRIWYRSEIEAYLRPKSIPPKKLLTSRHLQASA